MGRAGNGRWCSVVRLQHSYSGREENYVDGSWPGGSGCTKVQHQRLTGINLFHWRTNNSRIINYKIYYNHYT